MRILESAMFAPRIRNTLILLAASVGLSGCASYLGPNGGVSAGYGNYGYGDPYGYGYGDPYGRYGYGSRTGYGYGDPYGRYGSRYGYGYGSPYGYGYSPFGWYGGYYYPGTGYYVYDREQRRHPWSDIQRQYWETQRARSGNTVQTTENWSGFRTQAVKDGQRVRNRSMLPQGVVTQRQEQVAAAREERRSQIRVQRQQERSEARESRRGPIRVNQRKDD
jgi:hypothetical protein